MIVGIIHLEDGLVKYGNTFPDRPAGFFADVTEQTFLIKNTFTNSAWRWSGGAFNFFYLQA
jgi:hypothetical protein